MTVAAATDACVSRTTGASARCQTKSLSLLCPRLLEKLSSHHFVTVETNRWGERNERKKKKKAISLCKLRAVEIRERKKERKKRPCAGQELKELAV